MSTDDKELPLFRQESLDARDTQFLGTIILGKGSNFGIVAAMCLIFASVLVGYATYGTYTRKAKLPGILVPSEGALNILSLQSGIVSKLNVKEGETVRVGQILMTVDTDHNTASGATAVLIAQNLEQRRQSLESEYRMTKDQGEIRQRSYVERIRSMTTEQSEAEADVDALHERLKLGRDSVARYQELADKGYVPAIQAQQKKEELIDLQSRAIASERNLASLRRDTAALIAEKADSFATFRQQLVQIDRNQVSLEQERIENNARGVETVLAPRAGKIGSILIHKGSTIQANETLATLVPYDDSSPNAKSTEESTLVAELYAPSKAAGFVTQGQTVWIRYSAYNFQKFGMARGIVTGVSTVPVSPQDLPTGQQQALVTAVQANEPLFRITVNIERQYIQAYGQKQMLKPGLSLEADVLQDKRYIWEWIFEPLQALVASTSLQAN